jgi:hypothetical protein
MTVVTTLDVTGLTASEYRAVMDELGVEQRPEGGIYLHLTAPTDFGYRIVEIWDEKDTSIGSSKVASLPQTRRSGWSARRRSP